MKGLLTAAALAVIACGCVSVHKNDGGESNLCPPVVKDAVYEKYQVGPTVEAADEVQCLFGLICWGSSATHVADQAEAEEAGPVGKLLNFGGTNKAKTGAYANACEAAGCDHIVGARYTITTEDYFVYKKIKAEIKGYPVTLSGVEIVPPCCKK